MPGLHSSTAPEQQHASQARGLQSRASRPETQEARFQLESKALSSQRVTNAGRLSETAAVLSGSVLRVGRASHTHAGAPCRAGRPPQQRCDRGGADTPGSRGRGTESHRTARGGPRSVGENGDGGRVGSRHARPTPLSRASFASFYSENPPNPKQGGRGWQSGSSDWSLVRGQQCRRSSGQTQSSGPDAAGRRRPPLPL